MLARWGLLRFVRGSEDTARLARITTGFVVVFVVLVFAAACNTVPFGHYVDDIKWVLLAEAFLRNTLQSPWMVLPHIELMSWGPSLLLAPIVGLLGRNIIVLKLYMTLALGSGFLLWWHCVSSREPRVTRLLFLPLLCVNGFVLSFAGGVLSESFYLVVFAVLVYAAFTRQWVREGGAGVVVLLGLGSGLLVLVRAIGLLVFVCLALEFALARRWRMLLCFACAAAVCVAPYIITSFLQAGNLSFYDAYWRLRADAGLSGALGGMADNAYYYWKGLSCLTLVHLPSFAAQGSLLVKLPVMLLVGCAAVAGMIRADCHDPLERFLLVYTILYALVLAAWSYIAPRYALVIYPLFVYWVIRGIGALPRARGWAFAVLAAVAFISNAQPVYSTIHASLTAPLEAPHCAYDWLAAHAAPSDRVVSMDIARIHYHTGLRVMPFVSADSAEAFSRNSAALGGSYYVMRAADFTQASAAITEPIVGQYRRLHEFLSDETHFRRVHEYPAEGIVVLQRIDEGER